MSKMLSLFVLLMLSGCAYTQNVVSSSKDEIIISAGHYTDLGAEKARRHCAQYGKQHRLRGTADRGIVIYDCVPK